MVAVASPLVTLTKSASITDGNAAKTPIAGRSVERRFELQEAAQELLPGSRLSGCCRYLAWGHDHAELRCNPEEGTAQVVGVQVCGSVWECPVCQARITEKRRKKLGLALQVWAMMGGRVVMITYTLCHRRGDRLSSLLRVLSEARKKTTSRRAVRKLYEQFGVVGSVRALEVTHGANGWHPHVHELLFILPFGTDAEADNLPDAALQDGLRSQWSSVIKKLGARPVNEHGAWLSDADTDADLYVQKFGQERTWQEEHELTKQPVKLGKYGGRTPTQLLWDFCYDADAEAGRLWQEYAHEFHGKRQLFWSPGLLARLNLPPDDTDAEAAQEVPEARPSEDVLTLTEADLRLITANRAWGKVRQLGAQKGERGCGVRAVLQLLSTFEYGFLSSHASKFVYAEWEPDGGCLSAWERAAWRRGELQSGVYPAACEGASGRTCPHTQGVNPEREQ